MKKVILIVSILTTLVETIGAQSATKDLPNSLSIIPYNLQVGYNTTTVMVFPATVIDGDRGFSGIIIQKVENVLKIKAAVKDFQPTNLHVFTTDGKLYAFNVGYVEYPQRTTFDFTKLEPQSAADASVILTHAILSSSDLKQLAAQAKLTAATFSKKSVSYEMKLELNNIRIANDILLFGFEIANDSNLDFDIDFIRLFIKDKKRSKRTSVQEQDINILYSDSLSKVEGQNKIKFVLAVPKFTIPDKKEFFIQIFEKNGGRHIALRIKNKHLLKVIPF